MQWLKECDTQYCKIRLITEFLINIKKIFKNVKLWLCSSRKLEQNFRVYQKPLENFVSISFLDILEYWFVTWQKDSLSTEDVEAIIIYIF